MTATAPGRLPYRDGESEAKYRERCAVWSVERWGDHVEAQEIRTGKGWDQWSLTEAAELLKPEADRRAAGE